MLCLFYHISDPGREVSFSTHFLDKAKSIAFPCNVAELRFDSRAQVFICSALGLPVEKGYMRGSSAGPPAFPYI